MNWLARQDSVLPIPGAKDGHQATENARPTDFEITKDEAAKLDQVSRSWKQ